MELTTPTVEAVRRASIDMAPMDESNPSQPLTSSLTQSCSSSNSPGSVGDSKKGWVEISVKYDKKKDALIAKPSPTKQVPYCSAAAESAETFHRHQKASQKVVVETAILRAKQTQVDVRARALAHHHLAERFARFNKLLLSFAAILALITACFGVLSFKRESDVKAEYEKFNEHHDNSTLMASISTLNPLISLFIIILGILKMMLIIISAHCNFGGLAAAHKGTKQSLKRFNTRLDHYIQSLQFGICDAPERKETKRKGSKVEDVVHIREKFAHLKEDLCTLDDEAPALHGAWTCWTILPWWMRCRFTRCISEIKGENDELISPFDLHRRGMMVHFYELQCGKLEACKSKVVDEPKPAGKLVLPSNFGEEVVGRSKLTGKPLTASGTSGTKIGSSDHAFSIDAALEARKRWQKVDFWKEERKLRVQQEQPPYDFVAVRDIEAQGGHLDEDGKVVKLGPPSVIEFASPENSPGNSMNESSIGHGSFGGDMSPSNV